MNNIFVGNLSFAATKEDVKKLFDPFGLVADVVIMISIKGKSRGYGFVAMPNEEERVKAIAALEGVEFMQRKLTVSLVSPKVPGEVKLKEVVLLPRKEAGAKGPRMKRLGNDRARKASAPKPLPKKQNNASKPRGKAERSEKPFSKTRAKRKLSYNMSRHVKH